MSEQSDYTNVGFIGLGAMGKHTAQQLATKLPVESRIYIYDIVDAAMEDFVAANPSGKVIACKSPRDVAKNSKYILSMVPEGSHVQTVYLTPETGICSIDLKDRICIDCSTIDRATSLSIKQHIAETNHPSASFYDAPVSGGAVGAEKGTIAFFLGCECGGPGDPNIARLTALLRFMGRQVIPCGGPSLGLAAKLCNNYLSGVIALASSEALNMGIRAGLDPRVLSDVFAAGTAQNTICDKFNPCPGVVGEAPSSKGYEGGFKVQLMKKDFALAVDLARSVEAKLVLGEKGLETYETASEDSRCRDRDSRVVFRFIGGDEEWARKDEC